VKWPDRATWLGVVVVLLFGVLDYVAHHELVLMLIGTGVIVAGLVFGPHIVTLLLGGRRPRLPTWLHPVVALLPGAAYLLLRGPGSDVNLAVTAALMVVALVLFTSGRVLDRRLGRYYARRNRVPIALRLVAAPVLGLVLGYTLVHGSLGGLSQLWHAAAEEGGPGPALVPVVIAALVGAITSLLLLRDPAE
jgi:hypothetical protein